MKEKIMKKVLIIFCGGTIIMKEFKNDQGEIELKPPSDEYESVKILQEISPKLNIRENDIHFLVNIDSTEITPANWDELIETIGKYYDEFDGFVITHGTDTLAYTASALSIGLKNLNKPVILTGSQIPGSVINSDAARNLVNSYLLAQKNIRGVYIVFDERIILGSRATKVSESKLDAFCTVNAIDAGEIRVSHNLENCLEQLAVAEKLELSKGFDPDIWVYTITPGCDPSDLEFLLKHEKYNGIIIQGYGAGNIPKSFKEFFDEAEDNCFPIIISTQCIQGKTLVGTYESGNWFANYSNIIDGNDQSIETLTVKLQHGLAKFKNLNKNERIKRLHQLIHTDIY